MNTRITVVSLALAAVLGLTAAQGADDPAHKIALLEQDLLSTRKAVEALTKEIQDQHALLERTAKYAELQAKAAGEMASVLDESEKLGFAWGENFKSRQVLLAGWREALAAAQKDVPVVTASSAPAVKTPAH